MKIKPRCYARPLAGAALREWHQRLAILRGEVPPPLPYAECVRLLRAELEKLH